LGGRAELLLDRSRALIVPLDNTVGHMRPILVHIAGVSKRLTRHVGDKRLSAAVAQSLRASGLVSFVLVGLQVLTGRGTAAPTAKVIILALIDNSL
jgi:hypothetical protein